MESPARLSLKRRQGYPGYPAGFFQRSCVKVDVGAMTIIAQDDHLTAGAWAACGLSSLKKTRSFVNIDLRSRYLSLIFFYEY